MNEFVEEKADGSFIGYTPRDESFVGVLSLDARKARRRRDDPMALWFYAAEDLDEFIGIPFGRIAPGETEPEWTYLPHSDYDGIGGFAELLRRAGAEVSALPQLRHPTGPSWGAVIRALPKYLRPRRRVKWGPVVKGAPTASGRLSPAPAVAWHLFDEDSTVEIRRACRKSGVTINSFLLKHLTKAIRPSLQDPSSVVPWMVPVNLRGRLERGRDTCVHSSYVGVSVKLYETVQDVHRNIYRALGSGEHWANWRMYQMGKFITGRMRQYLIAHDLGMSQWSLGAFSNLGDWDAEKRIRHPRCLGTWLFSPLAWSCLPIAAGCVTFQNRLSLTIQAHPSLTTNPAAPRRWIQDWVREIEIANR